MIFPRIEFLEDVAPYISFDQGFAISRRPNHTVVDYVFTVPETFASDISLECRGLKFDREGRIIGRPFHKFFNLGERERLEDVEWAAPHAILDKLDGSMVHPVMLEGAMLFMTRMGATAQAALAQRHADQGVFDLSRYLLDGGITPIFEFTSPDNRVVVAYDTPALTLLAARAMVSGTYLPHAELARLAERFSVPLVTTHGRIADAKDFVARARQEAGIEGYVICFEDGHRLKLKTDGYALRHKALSGVQFEKNVLAWVATGAVDDVVAILPSDLAERVLAYQGTVNAGLAAHARAIRAFVAAHGGLPRKDFAALTMERFDKRLTQAVFATYDGKSLETALQTIVTRASATDERVAAVRDLFGMTWSVEGIALPDLEV